MGNVTMKINTGLVFIGNITLKTQYRSDIYRKYCIIKKPIQV